MALKYQIVREKRRPLWLFLGLGIFVLAMFGAVGNRGITGWERELLLKIYNWPDSLHWPFIVITQFGSAWLLYGFTAGLALVHRYRLALRIFMTGVSVYIATEVLKFVIARPRPAEIISGIHGRESSILSHGFPSGHAALATAISLSLWPYLPKRFRWLPFVWIPAVAVSRLYLGVHAPLDLVGGFGLGLIAAMAQQYVTRILPSRRAR